MSVIQTHLTKACTLNHVVPLRSTLLQAPQAPRAPLGSGLRLGDTLLQVAFLTLTLALTASGVAFFLLDHQPLQAPAPASAAGPANAAAQASCNTTSGCASHPSCPAGYDLVWVSDPNDPATACNMVGSAPMWDFQCVPSDACDGSTAGSTQTPAAGDGWGPFTINLLRMFVRK